MKITDDMLAAARRAAIGRMMSEGGCPEGEAMRAALEAVAPLIAAQARREALEDAAQLLDRAADVAFLLADSHDRHEIASRDEVVSGLMGFELGRHANSIRALIEKEPTT